MKVRLFVHSEDAALMTDGIQRGRRLFVHSEDVALMIDDLLQRGRIAIILEPMTIKTLFKRCTEQKKSTTSINCKTSKTEEMSRLPISLGTNP